MGVSGLFGVLSNRSPAAAEPCTVHAPGDAATASADAPPQRVLLFDANGLYHHVLYRSCASAPRSLGGEWAALAAATRGFLAPFVAARCALAAVWDGCASRNEAKAATRTQRSNDRRSKMRRFAACMRGSMEALADDEQWPPGCAPAEAGAEAQLPAPAGTLLCFVQVLQALGVPCWNSDGENDEHLAALAVFVASHDWTAAAPASASAAVASSAPVASPPIDIVGQDSDFLVLDTRIPGRSGDAVGYVSLDSYRFVSAGEYAAGEPASISFRRYTTESVCAALRLPACLLPALACLAGNDSKLDLLHFHCFTATPAFRRLLAEGQPRQATGGKLSRTNSSGEQSGSQVVESVLAFLQACSRSALSAAASHSRNAVQEGEQNKQHLAAMEELASRLFGANAATPRPSPSASPQLPESADSDEDDAAPSRSPDAAASSAAAASTALESFRAAQMKYSLARFFRQQLAADAPPAGWSVFDAGFHATVDETSAGEAAQRSASSSTAVLMPTELLRLYRSSSLSPVLLSVLLTRQYVGHGVLGDSVHPCAVHTMDDEGGCHTGTAAPASASSSQQSPTAGCLSASECGAGVRQRLYQLLFFSMDARPRPLPVPPQAESSGGLSGLLLSVGRGLAAALLPSSASSAASASDASSSAVAAAAARSADVTVWEHLPVATRASADDSSEWCAVLVRQQDEAALEQSVAAATDTVLQKQLVLFPPLFADDAVGDVAAREARWLRLCALFDTSADVLPPTTGASKLLPATARLLVLRSALLPLAQSNAQLAVLALVHRQVFLHACRPLLLQRFEPPAVGESMPSHSLAQMRRAILGLHAMALTTALTLGVDEEEFADVRAAGCSFSIEALALTQILLECYHTSSYAVQALRAHSVLQRSSSSSAAADSLPPPLPLLPLHLAFQGSLFHRVFVQLLRGDIEELGASKSQKQKKRKQPPASAGGPAAAAASSPAAASPVAASPSSPIQPIGLFSPALNNALCEMDQRVQRRALELLHQMAASRSPQQHAEALGTYMALKQCVWASVFGAPSGIMEQSVPAPSCPPFLEPLACIPFPRPSLPFESWTAASSSSPAGASASLSPPRSSTYFSLCSARDSAFPDAADACSCGLRGVELAAAAQVDVEQGDAGDDAEEEWSAASGGGKGGKRKKKGRGARGKR